MPLGDQLSEWFQLRDEKELLSDQLRKLNNQLDDLEQDILDRMNASKLTKAECDHGSVSKTSKMYPKVQDQDTFLDWIMADRNGRQHFLPRQANAAAVRELYQADGLLPDGVTSYTKESLISRRRENE